MCDFKFKILFYFFIYWQSNNSSSILIKMIIYIVFYFVNNCEKYVKKDYLLTQTELKFYRLLKQITDELNLVVCPQVALYQVVQNKNFKDFNKIQNKSIDFVIVEPNLKIKLCIELDDYTHKREKRIKRDEFLNKLFNDLEIKLLRIPVQNYYNLEELKKKIEESL